MANTPMVIMWGNSDGTVTLSQRQAAAEIMPTVVANPPRIATLSDTLSTTSGNSAYVYTIPRHHAIPYLRLWNYQSRLVRSSAILQQHIDSGTISLDLTNSGNGSTSGDSSRRHAFNASSAHGACPCIFGSVPAAFTPTWYTGHWIAQFGIAGPAILAGVIYGFKASGSTGYKFLDHHKASSISLFLKIGIVVFALYCAQCFIGALIHFLKPKNATSRPPQNYFHAVLGLTIIALSMYQIRTGYRTEWPNYTGLGPVPSGVNVLWMVWVVILPVMYAVGLLFLKKQYRQEEESRKEWNNEYGTSNSSLPNDP
ncbi:hypothetical protein K438DRAFT_1783852 [Mycena galopus ATCC 62051]|nr:hypothetical protein K438DRAFT_1783852 [Mycena galopus ATCC 62051]